MVPHYISTESTIDSRPSASPQKYQGPQTKGAWETFPKAISLLHQMEFSLKDPITTPEPEMVTWEEPITAPSPEVVANWDDIVSLGEEPPETSTEAETVKTMTELVDESMDYLFKEIIQDM
ncbi:hypothetical protein AMATHDRAFT_10270 [Amanita thiersii Skay4041]|uniref:Uncharacterized protein n=1 Tax=Amanita thiersii Skay4041 TaxID=703135 RepID=A0A2A9NB27_9AGAR|nr:hypothetical protein AMATHDRAFT_10270 [Amanita thiersii Skay4041]